VATSANLSGSASPFSVTQAEEQLSGKVEVFLDGGPTPLRMDSTVVDTTEDPPKILRKGARIRDVEKVIQAMEKEALAEKKMVSIRLVL